MSSNVLNIVETEDACFYVTFQVKDYGSCIAQRVPEIEHDMCLKEFLALKACMNTVVETFFLIFIC